MNNRNVSCSFLKVLLPLPHSPQNDSLVMPCKELLTFSSGLVTRIHAPEDLTSLRSSSVSNQKQNLQGLLNHGIWLPQGSLCL